MNAHQAIRPISISAAVFGMDEDGGGSQGGDDASLDDLFSEDQDANAQSPVEAEHGVEKIILSDDEETEVEVKETCRVLPTPGDPTDAQREEHRACGHIPYRTWCEECVASRATGEPHRRRIGERTTYVFAFDYLDLSKSGSVIPHAELGDREEVDLVILVAKDLMGKACFAHVVL